MAHRAGIAGHQRISGDQVAQLPPLHRDPFDRLLLAQAESEGLLAWSRPQAVS